MKIHLRFDASNAEHTCATLFLNGKNCGQLCMGTEDVVVFHDILAVGCRAVDQFVSSGVVYDSKQDASTKQS